MPCPYTEEQLAALVEAISTGARVVEYADKKVEYRSLADMLALKRAMEDCIGQVEATDANSGRRLAVFNSGK